MAPKVRGGSGSRKGLLSLDETLELLSNYQRRAIIAYLRDSPGAVHSIDELVAHLGEVEREARGEPPRENHLLSALLHIHCPKLDGAGLVDYDVPSGEVRYRPHARVEELLERIESVGEAFNEV